MPDLNEISAYDKADRIRNSVPNICQAILYDIPQGVPGYYRTAHNCKNTLTDPDALRELNRLIKEGPKIDKVEGSKFEGYPDLNHELLDSGWKACGGFQFKVRLFCPDCISLQKVRPQLISMRYHD